MSDADTPHPEAAPIRILHAFSTFAIGGAQMRFARLASALGPAYEHEIIAMDAAENGFRATELLDADVRFRTHVIDVRKGGGFDIGNLRRFRTFLKEMKPDLLITYNFGAVEWALINRIAQIAPHIHFEDGFGPDESADYQLLRRILARRAAIGKASRIVAPSAVLRTLIVDKWKFSPDQVSYIPNGVDVDAFFNPPSRHELRQHPDEVVIGAIGSLRPEKNHRRLISAVAALRASIPARLVIVGDGPQEDDLKAFAEAEGLSGFVEFTGARRDTEAFYAAFDIFALSSNTEQMPISVLEAMAASRPVISTEVGDVKAMLSPDNGAFVTPLGDDEAYQTALRRLALDEELRRRVGAANHERARSAYDEGVMATRYNELFREMAGRR